jgi:hypothetical protein
MTGVVAPAYEELHQLPLNLEVLYHVLIMENVRPIRIVFGHQGFRSEYALREAVWRMLEDSEKRQELGPGSFPQLIVSGQYSLLKMNGLPYTVRLEDGWWRFLASASDNPLLFLLEYLWTRFEREYEIGGFWGDDQEMEPMNPFIAGRLITHGDQTGWEYRYEYRHSESLSRPTGPIDWKPQELTDAQAEVFAMLCTGREVDLNDPAFGSFAAAHSLTVEELGESLTKTMLVAMDGSKLHLTGPHSGCAFLPDGRLVAADNMQRLTAWLRRQSVSASHAGGA